MFKLRHVSVTVVLAIIGVAISAFVAGAVIRIAIAENSEQPAKQPSESPPSITPKPMITEFTKPTPLSPEEEQRFHEEIKARARETGKILFTSGPETSGSTIQIASTDITLPSDAFVSRFIVSVYCGEDLDCPETPIYEIVRGGSNRHFD